MACEAQQFSGISQDQFARLLQKAQSAGMNIAGNSGSASRSGVTMTWNYDPGAQTLTIQCIESPFFIPCSAINSQLNDLVKAALT